MAVFERKTKIVATIGPATWDPDVLVELIGAGADVLRLNFSHGDAGRHAQTVGAIRKAAEANGREVAILGDLPGPKLRVGELRDNMVSLATGSAVTLTSDDVVGDAERIPVSWPALEESLKEGELVYLADGSIRLCVEDPGPEGVECRVQVGGPLSSHKGVNLPGADTGLPAVGESDLGWVDFAVDNDVDLLAVSFVRRAADLDAVSRRLAERNADIPLIAKIEKPQAAENAEEIIRAAVSGIMVARGDLGIEVPLAQVPRVQKGLIRLSGRLSKPVITATQMLASMVTAERPTRAEVTDVANAIYDGTDAVMLSEETAVGQNPVEAVRVMDRIARETEKDLPYGHWLFNRTEQAGKGIGETVAQGAVAAVYSLGLAALVVPTTSGRTARLVSAHRPTVPILAMSSKPQTVRRLNLLFGVKAVPSPMREDIRDLLEDAAACAKEHGVAESGDLIAVTAGLPDQELGTNLFEVHRVP